jgi:CheY-like chemotaxis protein
VPLTCVIVDDSLEFLHAASTLLEREGLAVLGTASSGAQAVEVTIAARPEVVLVDVSLHGESGFDVARMLHQLDHGAMPAIIMISTQPANEFPDLIERSPALGFIPKSEISANAVRAMVDRAPG